MAIVSNVACKYTAVSDRILAAHAKLGQKSLVFISAYAPTMNKSNETKDDFYHQLESYIEQLPKNNVLILAGDFNAKVGNDNSLYENVMGRHGKGMLNTGEERLLELATKQELILSNTLFKHKLAYVTIWTSSHKNKRTVMERRIEKKPHQESN